MLVEAAHERQQRGALVRDHQQPIGQLVGRNAEGRQNRFRAAWRSSSSA